MSGKGLTPAQILAKDKAARAANQAHLKLLYSQDGGVMTGQDYSQTDPYAGTDIASTAGEGGASTPELQRIAADLMAGKITTLDAFQFVANEAKPGGLLSDFAIVESGVNNGRDTTMHDMLFDKIKGWGGEVGKANEAPKGDGTGLPNQNDTYSADNAPMSDAIRSTRQNALKAYGDAAGGMDAWDASHKAPTKLLTTNGQVDLTVNNMLKHVLNGGKKPTGFVDALGQDPADVEFNKNHGDGGVDRNKMSKAELLKYGLDFSMGRAPKVARTDVPATKDVKQAGKDRAAYDTQRRSMRMDLNKKANDVRSSDRYMAAYTKELARLGITPRGDALKARDESLTNMGL